MRPVLPLLAGLLVVLLLAPGLLAEEQAAREKPRPNTDEQMKEHKVLERFKEGYADEDIDERMRALRRFGQWRHKKVLKELKKAWLKGTQLELLAIAAEGLGNQTPFARDAGKTLVRGLVQRRKFATREDPKDDEELKQKLEARVLVAGIRAVGELAYKDGWDDVKGFIDHQHDDVASETMLMCGRTKEYRALPIILEWFNYYPNGYSWSGGSVRVDTGAAGGADKAAAKAKWKAKYGSRKKKARPLAWESMVQAVEMLTGEKMSKPDELKAWMKENKLFLKKHGV